MKCQDPDCTDEAVCGIAINIPATGWPIHSHKPLRLVIGIELCDKHAGEVKSEDFLLDMPDGKESGIKTVARIMAKQVGGDAPPPDFDRAFFTKVPFNSKEWQVLKRSGKQ